MEVIPNKETFNKMKAALEKIVSFVNEKESNKGTFNASIRVDKNVFYIEEWVDSIHGVIKFVFNDTNNVERIVTENDIVVKEQTKTITLEAAKQEILDFFTNEFN